MNTKVCHSRVILGITPSHPEYFDMRKNKNWCHQSLRKWPQRFSPVQAECVQVYPCTTEYLCLYRRESLKLFPQTLKTPILKKFSQKLLFLSTSMSKYSGCDGVIRENNSSMTHLSEHTYIISNQSVGLTKTHQTTSISAISLSLTTFVLLLKFQ